MEKAPLETRQCRDGADRLNYVDRDADFDRAHMPALRSSAATDQGSTPRPARRSRRNQDI
jgi:hypothetical protein